MEPLPLSERDERTAMLAGEMLAVLEAQGGVCPLPVVALELGFETGPLDTLKRAFSYLVADGMAIFTPAPSDGKAYTVARTDGVVRFDVGEMVGMLALTKKARETRNKP